MSLRVWLNLFKSQSASDYIKKCRNRNVLLRCLPGCHTGCHTTECFHYTPNYEREKRNVLRSSNAF